MAEIECEKCYNNEAILKLPTKDVSFLQSYELHSFGFLRWICFGVLELLFLLICSIFLHQFTLKLITSCHYILNIMTKINCSFTGNLQCENYKSDWFCQFVQRFRNILAEVWRHCNYNWFWVLQKYNYSGWKIHQCSCQTELRKDFEHFK